MIIFFNVYPWLVFQFIVAFMCMACCLSSFRKRKLHRKHAFILTVASMHLLVSTAIFIKLQWFSEQVHSMPDKYFD